MIAIRIAALLLLSFSGLTACVSRSEANRQSAEQHEAQQSRLDIKPGDARLVVQTGHAGGIGAVTFSPDGKIMASGGVDRNIKLWEPATGEQHRFLERPVNRINSVFLSQNGEKN